MKHAINLDDYGPLAAEMADAVSKCVHCGFCLPACPTYKVLQEEMDSPRGRIILMKSALEKEISIDEALPYIDHCLGCLGCVSVCPSGVEYGNLISPFRVIAENYRQRTIDDNFSRWVTKKTLPYPGRFYFVTKLGNLSRFLSPVLPTQFQPMLDMVPESIPPRETLPEFVPAQGKKRGKVALQAGCVQQVLAQEINWATIRVLTRNGFDVVIPKNQGCCGALALHTGDHQTAFDLAKHNMDQFPTDVDAIISNAAGCGSAMHEYPLLFKETEFEDTAKLFSRKVMDISVFLAGIELLPIPNSHKALRVAYHDACHLSHAQGITREPRWLLNQIPYLTLVPINDGDLCCGSAGSYNLEQPEIASKLGSRKAKNILNTHADAVATGNIGCLVQLQNHLAKMNRQISSEQIDTPVMHTIELIDLAYQEKLSPIFN
jgi:glycolate oxidase iron-sulfur subunit